MILDFIDNKIAGAFSDAALEYDVLTSLHKEIGRELVKKVTAGHDGETILDIGMGTGWLTKRLKFNFPEDTIVGIDFAGGMLEQALAQQEGLNLVQADARALPFKSGAFAAAVSNLAFQWVRPLKPAFEEVRRVLESGGKLYLTLFGRDTLKELFAALSETAGTDKEKELYLRRLPSRNEIASALNASRLSDARVDYEYVKVRFPDMMAMVKWIKDIGANTLMGESSFIGKDWFKRAQAYYDKNFRDRFGVYTTFEVVWVEAKRDDD